MRKTAGQFRSNSAAEWHSKPTDILMNMARLFSRVFLCLRRIGLRIARPPPKMMDKRGDCAIPEQ